MSRSPACTLSVIILAYNSEDFVTEAVESVLAQSSPAIDVECIVVDNASRDNTFGRVRAAYEHRANVIPTRLDNGLGFSGGNNYGAGRARGDVLLFLNDDCVLEAGALQGVVQELEGETEIAIVQCAVADASGTQWRDLGHAVDAWGFIEMVEKPLARGQAPISTRRVFGAAGAALAIRSDIFRAVDGFDAAMSFLYEETDLCWRVNLLGYQIVRSGRATVRHRCLARYCEDDADRPQSSYELFTRNRLRSLMVNSDRAQLLPALTVQVAVATGFAARELARGNATTVRDTVRALGWVAARSNDTWRRRRAVQRSRVVSNQQLIEDGIMLRPSLQRILRRARRDYGGGQGVDATALDGCHNIHWDVSEPRVALVVLTYNGRECLPDLLASIGAQSYNKVDVVFVDNASTDGTLSYLLNHCPDCMRIIRNDTNLGCAAGWNIGARHCRQADILCLLNQDLVLHPRYAQEIADAFRRDTSTGAVQPLVLWKDDPSLVENCGHSADAYFNTTPLGHMVPFVDANIPQHQLFTLTAPGIDRRLFDHLGGLDEALFIYYEDTDFSIRIWRAGKAVRFAGSAVVYHSREAASRMMPTHRMAFLFGRNRLRLLWKNSDDWRDVLRLMAVGAGMVLAGCAGAVRSGEHGRALLQGVSWNLVHATSNARARSTTKRLTDEVAWATVKRHVLPAEGATARLRSKLAIALAARATWRSRGASETERRRT